jgi:hypothetical protein
MTFSVIAKLFGRNSKYISDAKVSFKAMNFGNALRMIDDGELNQRGRALRMDFDKKTLKMCEDAPPVRGAYQVELLPTKKERL